MADRGSNELRGTAIDPVASVGLQPEAALHLRVTSSELQRRKAGKGCVSSHQAAKGIHSNGCRHFNSALANTSSISFSDGGCRTLRAAKFFFFSSRRRHTRLQGDWSSDVCSSD